MNRAECETQILEKLEEIKEIYKQYNPTGTYLTMSIVSDSIMFWNSYQSEDEDKPIEVWVKYNEEDNEDE